MRPFSDLSCTSADRGLSESGISLASGDPNLYKREHGCAGVSAPPKSKLLTQDPSALRVSDLVSMVERWFLIFLMSLPLRYSRRLLQLPLDCCTRLRGFLVFIFSASLPTRRAHLAQFFSISTRFSQVLSTCALALCCCTWLRGVFLFPSSSVVLTWRPFLRKF